MRTKTTTTAANTDADGATASTPLAIAGNVVAIKINTVSNIFDGPERATRTLFPCDENPKELTRFIKDDILGAFSVTNPFKPSTL